MVSARHHEKRSREFIDVNTATILHAVLQFKPAANGKSNGNKPHSAVLGTVYSNWPRKIGELGQ